MNESSKNILIVDDDAKIRLLLRNCFEPEGFNVFEAENSAEVEQCISQNNIDLITLDLNLGTENGLVIASALRAKYNIPIIIVTGKGDVIDKVVGLEMGADDYIAKPFHVREVIARVRSVLRRSEGRFGGDNDESKSSVRTKAMRYKFNDWIADLETFELFNPNGELCELTSADFKILSVLLYNPKKVLSRDQIMDHINGNEWAPYDRTIDNQIARLRKKLEDDPSHPVVIKTVRGVGYTFATDVVQLEG